jgi:cytochrome c oxidase accessory protein FixG
MSDHKPNLINVQELAPQEVSELDLYQKREKIYTRKIEGFFQRLRIFTGWPLLLGYFLLPWLNWDGGHQAVLFDLPERQFHIFALTFWPQDFPMLAWLLIIAAFSLFAVTNFAGRVWCGYTCPQTVWTSIFMWAEQITEGSRNQRIKLDKAPRSAEKVFKKFAKHSLWLGVAALTGFTFVGYFYSIRELVVDFFTLQATMWAYLWVLFFTCATYINAGWMREQV